MAATRGSHEQAVDGEPEAAAEAAWLEELAAFVDASESRTRLRAQAIARAALRREPSDRTTQGRYGWWLVGSAAVGALAASAALVWIPSVPPALLEPAPAYLAPGASISARAVPVCLPPAAGAHLCLEPATTVRRDSAPASADALELVAGEATIAWTAEAARPLRIHAVEIRPRGPAAIVLRHASKNRTSAEVTAGVVEFAVAGTRWEARPGDVVQLDATPMTHTARDARPTPAVVTPAAPPPPVEVEPLPPPAPAEADAVVLAPPSTYLERAREFRRQGRWQDAARTYHRLQRAHPQSDEARVSWVSLGDLQLDRLDEPASAIRSYHRYLAAGGRALDFEARHGLVLAYRKLGQPARERAALEALLEVHPTPDPSLRLRARLEALRR